MATAKQLAWRKKFAARYGGKKKEAKARTSPRTSQGGNTMARRRSSRRKSPRRVYASVRRRYVRRTSAGRVYTLPTIDILHGIYTADGVFNNQVSKTGISIVDGVAGMLGTTSTSWDPVKTVTDNAKNGLDYAMKDPKKAVIGGVKNFGTLYLLRAGLKWVGVPKSVKVTKKFRLQVR